MSFNKISSEVIELVLDNYISSTVKAGSSVSDLGYRVYADAAGVTPVDGTGGTPGVTLSVNTLSPLSGSGDLRLVKDAVNRQGNGFSTDFTVANRHLAKVLQVTFDTELISGTYSAGDLRVYLVQDPNGTPVVLEPVGTNLELGVANQRVRKIATFQTHVSVTSYRLCVHVSTTSTSAYTVDFANFKVWEPNQSIGAVITDWQNFTMTITGTTTNPTKGTGVVEKAMWRRVGSNAEIFYTYNHSGAGSSGSGNYLFSMPPGLSIDTSKLSNNTGFGFDDVFGVATVRASTNNGTGFVCLGSSPNTFFIGVTQSSSGSIGAVASNYYNLADPGIFYSFMATVPIAGWGSSVAMSSDTGDSRVVAARYTNPTTSGSVLVYQTRDYDTHGAYSNGVFTAPVNGYYRFSATIRGVFNSQWAVQIDEVTYTGAILDMSTGGYSLPLTDTVFLRANQRLRIIFSAGSLSNAITSHAFSIERISAGSQVIATSETVACRYDDVSTASFGTTGFGTTFTFTNRVFDTHGAYSGGTYTVPVSGVYVITAKVGATSSLTTGQAFIVYLFRNGSVFDTLGLLQGTGAASVAYSVGGSSGAIRCIAGDTFRLQVVLQGGGTAVNDATRNVFTVTRIGI